MARTAVIAGTATSVSNRVSRRQGNRWAAKEAAAEPQYEQQPPPQYAPQPQYAPPPPQYPPPPDTDRTIEQLKKLGELHTQGILTDEEFAQQKAAILA